MADKNVKTVFVSLLDGTQEELYELRNIMEAVNVNEKYSVILSGKPIQSIDPVELLDQLRYIHLTSEQDQQYDMVSRDRRVLHSLIQMQKAIEAITIEIETLRKNDRQLAGASAHTLWTSDSLDVLENINKNLEHYLPKEGEKW